MKSLPKIRKSQDFVSKTCKRGTKTKVTSAVGRTVTDPIQPDTDPSVWQDANGFPIHDTADLTIFVQPI